MRFFLPTLIALTLFATPVSNVMALDATTSGKPVKPIQKIEQRKNDIVQKLDQLRDKIASREAELKSKLSLFKDKKKAVSVERINTNLAGINKRRTDHMLGQLDKMASISAKLQDMMSKAKTSQDLSAVQTAITETNTAIAIAKTAVTTQAELDYTIKVSSESAVRTDAKAARDQLHKDLQAVQEKVVAARKALSAAISSAMSTMKGTDNGQ